VPSPDKPAGLLISEGEARFERLRRRAGLVLAPVVFVALVLAPLPGLSPQAHMLAAVASATVVFWVTEAIPLAVAALLGPALAVLLGVTDAEAALAPFADPLIFLFMGGFMLAGGLSRQGFDRRAALWLLARPMLAGSPTRALAAIAFIAFAFSMWLSNTATTAMLIPVALGLVATMKETAGEDERLRHAWTRFGGGMCLTLAYAASIGGTATPIGTGPNVIALGMIEDRLGIRFDFLQWMSFALPTAIVMFVVVVALAVRRFAPPMRRIDRLKAEVDRQLEALGPISPGERRAVAVFALAVVGWLLPSVLKIGLGTDHPWTTLAKSSLDEGVVAIVCASLLFALPSGAEPQRRGDTAPRLLGWQDAQNIDWGTLFLLGGGLALGRMTFDTGLADAIGRGLLDVSGPIAAHPAGLMAVSVLLVIFLTEVTSNTATTSMMLPVLIGLASAGGMDPIPTAIAVTLAASFAFMLPVSTPPNAMAYGTRMIRLDTMLSFGLRLDLLGYVLLLLAGLLVLPVFI
jgi:solute carrier family 13 (sodium-dependent dicarboxylate transporter), member 2/3/5